MYTYVYECLGMYVCMYMYICMYVCIYIYIYIHMYYYTALRCDGHNGLQACHRDAPSY